MLGASTPVTCSRNRKHDVWSNGSLHTQPPAVQGDTMMPGTRKPGPTGSPLPGSLPATIW